MIMKYNFIPYNKDLVLKAGELRNNPTPAEKIFWEKIIKDGSLKSLIFLRQKPLGHFIVDFYCSSLRLAIEIDGEVHLLQKTRDLERDNFLLKSYGIKVIRYKNLDILENSSLVLKDLLKRLDLLQQSPLDKGDGGD